MNSKAAMLYAAGSAEFRDFALESGDTMPAITVAYRSAGRLAADASNAILVLHGYTGGTDMILPDASPAEGSWGQMIGPRKAIDTDRFFVLCPNMLGSSFGSTNAASIDPNTGKAYGPDFPPITMVDIVRSQRLLLGHLGIEHVVAVCGASFGGIQTFQWGVSYPGFMDALVPVSASTRAPKAPLEPLLARLESDPNWNAGRYYETGGVTPTLRDIRVATLKSFGLESVLAERFPDADDRARELEKLAQPWADAFDAHSLIILLKAALAYDVHDQLERIAAPVLFVLARTDPFFPPSIAPEVMSALHSAHVAAEYYEIDSEHGHAAPSVDAAKWAGRLHAFLVKD